MIQILDVHDKVENYEVQYILVNLFLKTSEMINLSIY